MAYIGLEPSNSFVSLKRQVITGDGTTSYTLDHSVASVNDVAIFVNNVRQDPASYSISGTALTLGGTISSSDSCYVIFLGQALQTVTPATGTVTNAMITSNAGIATTKLGAGAVLQVLSTSKTDTFTTTSNSFVDITGFTVSITPSSTSSKIFVMANLNCSGTAGVTAQYLNLVRDSTDLLKGDADGSRARVSTANITADNAVSVTSSMSFLDSPSSTSALVYKVQTASSASGTVYVNRTNSDTDNFTRARGASTITVMEIAG